MLAVCSGYVWLFFMYSIGAVCTNLKFWDRKMSPCEFFWLSSQCGYSLRLHSVWLTWTAALRQYGDETITEKQWETQDTRDMINPYTTQHHTVRQSRGNVFEWIDEVVFILIKRVDYRNVGKNDKEQAHTYSTVYNDKMFEFSSAGMVGTSLWVNSYCISYADLPSQAVASRLARPTEELVRGKDFAKWRWKSLKIGVILWIYSGLRLLDRQPLTTLLESFHVISISNLGKALFDP